MRTETNVNSSLKDERRKLFHAMNALPWILLCVVLSLISVYFYSQSTHTLNAVETVEPVADSLALNTEEIQPREISREISSIDPILEFKIEAVSNKHAEWSVNVRGETTFRWLDHTNIIAKTTHGMSAPEREYKFTVGNLEIAKEINLDIEKEINRIIDLNIEASFFGLEDKKYQALKDTLKDNIGLSIKKIFDGFETFNKENARR